MVQEVRAQYEQVVSDIQPQKDFPFADESVTWPCKGGLCYPVFQTMDLREENTREPPQASAPRQHTREPPQVSTPRQPCTECHGIPEEVGEELVFNKDRESLLEIRSKVGMELVWLKQAITSRQKVAIIIIARSSKNEQDCYISFYSTCN